MRGIQLRQHRVVTLGATIRCLHTFVGVSPLEAGVDVGLHDEVHAEVGAGHLRQLAALPLLAAPAVPRLAPAAHRGEGSRAKIFFC